MSLFQHMYNNIFIFKKLSHFLQNIDLDINFVTTMKNNLYLNKSTYTWLGTL